MRILTLLLIAVAILSCSADKKEEYVNPPGKGSVLIGADIDKKVEIKDKTRATSTDPSGYYVILSGADSKTLPMPSDGVIGELTPGSYSITVTSHPAGIPAPAFDTQVYTGTLSGVNVEAGKTAKPGKVTCTQANAGVYFVYDESLVAAGLGDVIPTLTHADGALEYKGADRLKIGYFAPGNVTLTLENGQGDELTIGNQASHIVSLGVRELWKIRLWAPEPASGSIQIQVEVIPTDTYTDEDDFEVGKDDPGPSKGYAESSLPAGKSPLFLGADGRFGLEFTSGSGASQIDMVVEGYTAAASFGSFSLRPGVYVPGPAKSAAEGGTLIPGETEEVHRGAAYKGTYAVVGGSGGTVHLISQGVMTVKVSGGKYVVEMDMKYTADGDPQEIKMRYEGPLVFEDASGQTSGTYASAELIYYDDDIASAGGRFTLDLFSEEPGGGRKGVMIDGYAAKAADPAAFSLASRTYNVASSCVAGTMLPGGSAGSIVYGSYAYTADASDKITVRAKVESGSIEAGAEGKEINVSLALEGGAEEIGGFRGVPAFVVRYFARDGISSIGDVALGDYEVRGTPAGAASPAPAEWDATVTKEGKYAKFSGWAGLGTGWYTEFKDGGLCLEQKIAVATSQEDMVIGKMIAATYDGTALTPVPGGKAPIGYDAGSGGYRFFSRYNGVPVFIGCEGTHTSNGEKYYDFGDFYTDVTITPK